MRAQARAEGWSEGFRERFGEIVDRVGGTRAAAGIAGCSHDQISNYREGRSKIPLVVAHRLCEAVGIALDRLVDDRGEAVPADGGLRSIDHRHLSGQAVLAAATLVVEASRSFPTLAASDIAEAIVSRSHEEQARLDELTIPTIGVAMRNH